MSENKKEQIAYIEANYKYQLAKDYSISTKVKPSATITIPRGNDDFYVQLQKDGNLTVKPGYAWDGASGPTIDTSSVMRASLVHDALYQCMRYSPDKLSGEKDRKLADKLFHKICRKDKMGWFRAQYFYWAVRWFGRSSASPKKKKDVVTAP